MYFGVLYVSDSSIIESFDKSCSLNIGDMCLSGKRIIFLLSTGFLVRELSLGLRISFTVYLLRFCKMSPIHSREFAKFEPNGDMSSLFRLSNDLYVTSLCAEFGSNIFSLCRLLEFGSTLTTNLFFLSNEP